MEWLEVKEAADRLGLSDQMIYKLIRQGDLEATQAGRVYRISTEDVDSYIERGRQKVRERVARHAAMQAEKLSAAPPAAPAKPRGRPRKQA